ncbi:MAG TPA: serine protease [Kiritimatiellia bacterium]|nr:serine protease [Kiritimatiellia bacterium]
MIFRLTARYCAALFYNTAEDVAFGCRAESIKAQGTLTFVRYETYYLGITNEHVVGKDYSGPCPEKLFSLALKKHTPLPGQLIFKSDRGNQDFPYDIAVFELDKRTVEHGGKCFYDFRCDHSGLSAGDLAFAVGFPGRERRVRQVGVMEHPLYHVCATCQGYSDRQIVLQNDLPGKSRDITFGGMSGGPIFKEMEDNQYELLGIAFEGRGFGDREEGSDLNSDIWVFGFPLTRSMLAFVMNNRGV